MEVGMKELRELLGCGAEVSAEFKQPLESLGWCIVVLDRGFVVVGDASRVGCYIVIHDCSCVRRWGTTKGLGELAMSGPLENTKLDKQPYTRVHELRVVQIIDCEASKWTR